MKNRHAVKLLHYHITNLDSVKIEGNAHQVAGAGKIINMRDFDILSLNGIQYDYAGVPNESYQSTGLNLSRLLARWGVKLEEVFFTPSNIGANAKKKSDQSYFVDSYIGEAMAYADQINFGTMPGQLSTAGAFGYEILESRVFTNLAWRDFNSKVDFNNFSTAIGGNFPSDTQLFDKSFSDVTINVGGKHLHIILLHAAPSHNFGNPRSINVFRNAEQLRFLEWYISGETDHPVDLIGIKPLTKDDYYVIVGDLNVDLKNVGSEGSKVLNRIISNNKPWMNSDHMLFTIEATHFAPNPFRLVLDYIIVSNNIQVLEGGVIHPDFTRQELGADRGVMQCPDGKSIVKYRLDEDQAVPFEQAISSGLDHHALVEEEYLLFKGASYHYPIYAELRLT